MRKETRREYNLAIEMNRHNQPELVATDIEHADRATAGGAHGAGVRVVEIHFDPVSPGRPSGESRPIAQPACGGRMPLSRGAAKGSSPRRETWVGADISSSP